MVGSAHPVTYDVERSLDNGTTWQSLSTLPYGLLSGVYGACVVIVDDDTVFVGKKYNHTNIRAELKR